MTSSLSKIYFCIKSGARVSDQIRLICLTTKLFIKLKTKKGTDFIIQDKKLYQINIKSNGKRIALSLRLQDIAIFFEIFKDKIYQFNIKNNKAIIIDLGAHIGLASLYFCSLLDKDCIIYCLEPDPSNFKILSQNLNKYPAQLHQIAIYKKQGEVYLSTDSFAHNNYVSEAESSIKTKCTSLSHFINEQKINKIDLLKIDIEGAEKYIFQSDLGWLSLCQNIIIETHSKQISQKIQELLKNEQFTCISNHGILYCHRI